MCLSVQFARRPRPREPILPSRLRGQFQKIRAKIGRLPRIRTLPQKICLALRLPFHFSRGSRRRLFCLLSRLFLSAARSAEETAAATRHSATGSIP